MASWRDGPEYAPLERPAEFDPANVAPLDQAPPFVQPTANAPADRPRFDGPTVALAPLEQLVPVDDSPRRDPQDPFDVATGTLTESSSAWSAARGALPGGVQSSPVQAGWGPPTGAPVTAPPNDPANAPANSPMNAPATVPGSWPAPDQPFVLTSSAPAPQNGYAAPGTNAWFGYPAPQQQPPPVTTRVGPAQLLRAMTPGVVITLLIGLLLGLATSIVPLTYVIAWVLATRIRVSRRLVLRSFLISGLAIVFFWFIRLVTAMIGGDATYSGFELLSRTAWWFSLLELIVTGALVFTGLRRGGQPPPGPGRGAGGGPYPPNSPWG